MTAGSWRPWLKYTPHRRWRHLRRGWSEPIALFGQGGVFEARRWDFELCAGFLRNSHAPQHRMATPRPFRPDPLGEGIGMLSHEPQYHRFALRMGPPRRFHRPPNPPRFLPPRRVHPGCPTRPPRQGPLVGQRRGGAFGVVAKARGCLSARLRDSPGSGVRRRGVHPPIQRLATAPGA